jgi:hypothetical protein
LKKHLPAPKKRNEFQSAPELNADLSAFVATPLYTLPTAHEGILGVHEGILAHLGILSFDVGVIIMYEGILGVHERYFPTWGYSASTWGYSLYEGMLGVDEGILAHLGILSF